MTITLPPALAVFVGYAVRTGPYRSELDLLHQALQLLSDRDLRALVQEGIDSAEAGGWIDADTVHAEIGGMIAVAAAEAKANPGKPASNEELVDWIQDGLDYLDLGNVEYARELLVGLRDRLKSIVAQQNS
jgi:putative addiction module CopG family antidote